MEPRKVLTENMGGEVDFFFSEYVFNFIRRDIEREIALARAGNNASNFLAALGLLCYTDMLGGFISGSWEHGRSRGNFDVFFDALGDEYVAFRKAIEPQNPYSVYRCGMVHEYAVKEPCRIAMLKVKATCGVWKDAEGRYQFCVEKYFEDFMVAAWALYDRLMATPSVAMPKR
ncbi:MAG: hypothetical protein AB1346_10285 [Thermodesulfobacteriota bacterium]